MWCIWYIVCSLRPSMNNIFITYCEEILRTVHIPKSERQHAMVGNGDYVDLEYIHPEDEFFEDSEFQEDDDSQYETVDGGGYKNYEQEIDEYSDYDFSHYEENDGHFPGSSQEILFSCDTCDRDFYSKAHFDKHMSEHRTCSLDGCKFTAHEKIVEKHVLMQHATGLYDKIRNINTPEDIAKWVEERKKRFPSRENILKRQEKQEQMLKRGERIKKRDNRFGKDRFRMTKNVGTKLPPKRRPKQPFVKEKKPVSLINEKVDWNGTMYPFKGTSMLDSDTEKEKSDFEDEEWSNNPSKPVQVKLNNALGALMGAYMSGSETDEEQMPIEKDTKQEKERESVDQVKVVELKKDRENDIEDVKEDSDGEPPTEVKIQKEKLQDCVLEKKEEQVPPNKNKTRKRKRNKMNKSGFRNRGGPRNVTHSFRNRNQSHERKDNFPYSFRKRKVSLLEKLLDSDIRHERNLILQCVRYVVENNFFKSSSTVSINTNSTNANFPSTSSTGCPNTSYTDDPNLSSTANPSTSDNC